MAMFSQLIFATAVLIAVCTGGKKLKNLFKPDVVPYDPCQITNQNQIIPEWCFMGPKQMDSSFAELNSVMPSQIDMPHAYKRYNPESDPVKRPVAKPSIQKSNSSPVLYQIPPYIEIASLKPHVSLPTSPHPISTPNHGRWSRFKILKKIVRSNLK